MMGEELRKHGCARLVGADIIHGACEACQRDRPTVYDDYEVVDFSNLTEEQRENLQSWSFDCLTTVAALGFGDIPAKAFIEAFNILQSKGWLAFNVKETFLDKNDTTGFSVTTRELIFSDYLDIYYLERYRHRLSMEGQPLYYFAIAGRKNADIPQDFLRSIGIRTYRDREESRNSPLPHHAAYRSVVRSSADQDKGRQVRGKTWPRYQKLASGKAL